MTNAEEFFKKLTGQIDIVKPGKMFGALCMKTPNGKSAAMVWRDHLVVKLNENSRNEALNLSGAKVFEPMEGRPMKEWVQIPFLHKDRWKEYALLSIKLVKDLHNKSTK
jgi:TfoX/Sxy family transcriptional regulator of competence genes